MKNQANKILNKIKKMNLSKEILLSLNFKDLITFLNESKADVYELIQFIILNYTDLESEKYFYLWLTHKTNNYNELMEAIKYKNDFNYQMAQNLDESIM